MTDNHRTRSRSRPVTPAPRVLSRQHSDPVVTTPQPSDCIVEQHDYLGRPAMEALPERYPSQQGPPLRRARASTEGQLPEPLPHSSSFGGRHGHFPEADEHGREHRRTRSGSRRWGGRRGQQEAHHFGQVESTHLMHDPVRPRHAETGYQSEDDTPAAHGHRLIHAPSPPPSRSSSLEQMRETEIGERGHQRRRLSRDRRSRSRSRSWEEEQAESRFLRPGDEVTVIERHEPRRREDYDWYDRDGMRVRVREI